MAKKPINLGTAESVPDKKGKHQEWRPDPEWERQRLKLVEAQNKLNELLVGKEVRVYVEGSPLTQDFVIGRVNIELDEETANIKGVWFG